MNHEPFDRVLRTHVKNGFVDDSSLRNQRGPLDEDLKALAAVRREEFEAWPGNERLAFLIILYNASTLRLLIDHYPVSGIKEIGGLLKGPWDLPVVSLFAQMVTMNELEHGIIRIRFREPRIHMALVCAAKGCPPLRGEAYAADRLDAQLNEQARFYLASPRGMRIDTASGKVYGSLIFKWYSEDFRSVMEFVEFHSGRDSKGYSLRYLEYDWSLNGR